MGENVCKRCDRRGINLQQIQRAHIAQYQKTPNNPIQKWAEDLNRHFSKKRHTDGQHEKMLNIAKY